MNKSCGFSLRAAEALVCPTDGEALGLDSARCQSEDGVIDGWLICRQGHRHQIRNGILHLLPAQPSLDDLAAAEIVARDQSADAYDQKLASRYDKEIPSTLKLIGSTVGKKCIEYGCGTGRFTTLLLEAELLIATDFSLASLEILSRKLRGREGVGLVWADATQFRTQGAAFDLALSFQVLEHLLPTSRQYFLTQIKNSLTRHGSVVISAYHFDWRRWLAGRPVDGRHRSGIFYHYFTRDELTRLVGHFFAVRASKIIDITFPLESRWGLSKLWGGPLSRWAEQIPLVRGLGHLVLIRADKND